MVNERFNKLNDLCDRSKVPFSSLKDGKSLSDELGTILKSEEGQLDENEMMLYIIIGDNVILKFFELVSKIDAENIALSDDDLAYLEERESKLLGAGEVLEKEAKGLEKTSNNDLLMLAKNRREKVIKNIGLMKGVIGRVIRKEKTRRQNPSNDNNGGNNNNDNDNYDDTNKKITNLQNQINTLEEKLRKQPNSGSNSEDKEKLERLKAEIEALKRKQKDKPQNENEGTEKNNFPYGLVIGGGVVIFLLLIAVIFF